jgi:small multidrug resistance family-3 protein
MEIIKSAIYFVLAGLCEIGGGYLIWLWLRQGRSLWFAIAGALLLAVYGVIPTLQPASFGRVYAAYGSLAVLGMAGGRDCSR